MQKGLLMPTETPSMNTSETQSKPTVTKKTRVKNSRTARRVAKNPKIVANQGMPVRYVMYLRKSSEDEQSQPKSLEDQEKDCLEYAAREGLLVIGKPIKESKSAKTSGNRPKFTQMIEDIKAGKYDGILAWHPDRLARNSLESGIIIDMLDSGQIRDLQFPTCRFENNASGKLLLNILFAMSKQYSEHLAENVQRGTDTNWDAAKSSGEPKWGYTRSDITGYYEPDENFDKVRKCWDMRLAGHSLQEIADYCKKEDIHRITKTTRRKQPLHSTQQLSPMFRDPFHFGILEQVEDEKDLRTIPEANFKPMITEEEFDLVQAMNRSNPRSRGETVKGAQFYPLRRFVHCAKCHSEMRVGKSKSKSGKYFLYFRCDNEDCPVKSIRAKVLFDALYAELGKMKFSEKEYKKFEKEIDVLTEEQVVRLRQEKRSLEGSIKVKTREKDGYADSYSKLANDESKAAIAARERLNKQIEAIADELIDLNAELDTAKKKIVRFEQTKLTKDEFLNLINCAENKMRAGTPVQKDDLCRKMLLNTELDTEKGASFLWKEPFNSVLKVKSSISGGDMWT